MRICNECGKHIKESGYVVENGVEYFVEIGPGKTLAGFLRKIDRSVKVYNIGTWEDVDKMVGELTV